MQLDVCLYTYIYIYTYTYTVAELFQSYTYQHMIKYSYNTLLHTGDGTTSLTAKSPIPTYWLSGFSGGDGGDSGRCEDGISMTLTSTSPTARGSGWQDLAKLQVEKKTSCG